MKKVAAIVLVLVAIALAIFFIDVDQTEEARLPDVDIEMDGGNLPEFDAEVGDIDVGKKDATIKVPDVDVDMEKTTISIPTIDVESPEEERIDEGI